MDESRIQAISITGRAGRFSVRPSFAYFPRRDFLNLYSFVHRYLVRYAVALPGRIV